MALAAGTGWLERGANLLMFGPPGSGKSHACAGLGHALVENGYRVLFARTSDLVQRLQLARQALQLEQAIAKLDRFDLLILDDFSYVARDQAETSVLFELIAAQIRAQIPAGHRQPALSANGAGCSPAPP
jgi:DNA replication protein DnaC